MRLTDAELAVARLEALRHPHCVECRLRVRLIDEVMDSRVREAVAVLSPEALVLVPA